MKEVLIISLMVVFLMATVVSAQDIDVHVQTLKTHDVHVSIIKPIEKFDAYDIESKYMGYNDEIIFNFSIDQKLSNYGINVVVKKDNQRVIVKRFEDFSGNKAYIKLMSEEDAQISSKPFEETNTSNSTDTNETLVGNETDLTNNESLNESFVLSPENKNNSNKTPTNTGNIISNLASEVSRTKYYIFGIAGVLVLVFFMIVFGKKMIFSSNKPKQVEHVDNDSKPIIFDDNRVKDAEKKLRQARSELKEMEEELGKINDKKRKMDEVKRKLREDHEELERLKKESDEGKNFYK